MPSDPARSRAVRAAVAGTLLLAGIAAIGRLTWSTYAPLLVPHPPPEATAARAVTLDAPRRVRLDTRVQPSEEAFAGQRVRLRVRFDAPGAIELLLRQREAWMARYQVLLISSDARMPSGFVEASSVEFAFAGGSAGSGAGWIAPIGREVAIEVVADGPELSASADGERIARGWDARMLSGTTSVQGVRGEAALLDLSITPLPWPEHAARRGWLAALVALAIVASIALVLLGAEILHRGTGTPRARALRREAIAWSPLAAYAIVLQLEKGAHLAQFLAAAFLFFALKGALFLARRATLRWPAFLVGIVHAGAVAYLTAILIAPRLLEPDVNRANALTHYHWQGTHLPQDLLWYLHPLCRRWNDFLANRQFRTRAAALEKPPETTRIVCLGTSSTYGHGFLASQRIDFPAQLEDLLTRAVPDRRVEVLNAAVPGSNGSRLLPFFRDVLCEYHPDILVLDLAYNDAAALSQCDEHAYYERIVADDYENSFWQRLRERFGMRWRQQRYVTNRDLFARGRLGAIERGKGERNAGRVFEVLLGDYLKLCRARGVRLLLIAEPTRTPIYLVAELHAAMRRFADDEGVPLLDPAPALEQAGGAARFQDDVHPDAAGHAVIAAQIAQLLIGEKLL